MASLFGDFIYTKLKQAALGLHSLSFHSLGPSSDAEQ